MNKIELIGQGEKNILILSGVHGNELTPILSSMLLCDSLKSEEFIKTYKKLIILNFINLNGIRENIRDIPHSINHDFNRKFPLDKPDYIFEIVDDFIRNSDIVIDIHSSPSCLECILINQDKFANSYINFSIENNINYIVRYNYNNTIKKHASDLNKKSFTVELNGMNILDERSAVLGENLILNIIKNVDKLNLIEEFPKFKTFEEIFYFEEGLFIQKIELGDIVKKGDVLGEVINPSNYKLTKIYYQNDYPGKLIYTSNRSYITPNNSFLYFQPVEESKI